ncbi:hypothetical protein EMIT0P265_10049 [Pseudomonas zeae]
MGINTIATTIPSISFKLPSFHENIGEWVSIRIKIRTHLPNYASRVINQKNISRALHQTIQRFLTQAIKQYNTSQVRNGDGF